MSNIGISSAESTQEQVKPELKSQLIVGQLKYSYANLPHRFFEAKMSPMQFGFWCLEFFKTSGLTAGPDVPATPVLGYAFCSVLSPVQIAVYCYYCFNGSAGIKEVAKKRKLTPRIVVSAKNELLDLGLLVEANGALIGATLDDLVGPPEEEPKIS